MILNVRVSPKASRNLVKKEGDVYKVYLTKPSQDGLANEQLVGLLADYLKAKKYQLKITKGFKGRDKLIEFSE